MALIRVVIGIMLISNSKFISKQFKYAITVIYYGTIFGCTITGYFDLPLQGIFVGVVSGFIISCLIVKIHKTEHIVNLLTLVMYYYIIVGYICRILNVSFSEIFSVYDCCDIDYTTIYAIIIISVTLAVISYIILYRKNKFRQIIDDSKYFWMGNYFIIGAVTGFLMFPVYGPGDCQEMCIVLLNIFYDFDWHGVVLLETVVLLVYRGYKRTLESN